MPVRPARSAPRRLLPVLLSLGSGILPAQVFDEDFDLWPPDLRIGGTVIVAPPTDGGPVAAALLPGSADGPAGFLLGGPDPQGSALSASLVPALASEGRPTRLEILAGDAGRALERVAQEAELIVLDCRPADLPTRRSTVRAWTEVLHGHLDRGGTLVVRAGLASWLGAWRLQASTLPPALAPGWGIVPDAIVTTGYRAGPTRSRRALLSALAARPRLVGIGLEAEAALVFTGRKLRAGGHGRLHCLLAANDRQPIRHQAIAPPGPGVRPEAFLVDLTEWRRDAIDRTIEPFPPAAPPLPRVEHGTLVIVGGGGMPAGLMDEFIRMAGGPEDARLVFVPCSESEQVPAEPGQVRAWRRAGVRHATFIHTKDRRRAHEDEDFLAPLREATGIWFGGGRQWNFADSYYGTTAHRLMKEVLQRGGVVGGSSAGASIQARYLARATPIGNHRIMAPGYERGGLGFIGGVAIDQHFSERGRQKDMTTLVDRHPQLLGIGIDETTALIVRGSTARVVGAGDVYFYDRRLPVHPDRPDFLVAPAGSAYDLAGRRLLESPPDPE